MEALCWMKISETADVASRSSERNKAPRFSDMPRLWQCIFNSDQATAQD